MGDWLGTGTIATHLKEYRPFKQAREYIHSLHLKNSAEWRQFCKSGNKPEDIPSNPGGTYKNAGWKGMGDWLGTGTIATRFFGKRSFKQAREYVHSLNLKNINEWKQYSKSGKKPNDIPADPYQAYNNEWKGWSDFLGTMQKQE